VGGHPDNLLRHARVTISRSGALTLVGESSGHGAPSAFGHYRVLHQIGSGVLGPVFRGFDPQRDRIVAIKAFKLDLLPEDVARLAASLRRLAAAGFTHPQLVNLIDAGLEGTTPFLVAEYVSGETLDVARRQMPSDEATAIVPWLRQIAGAIDDAHRAGWRHGALHPRDVLVAGRTREVRITGFGIAGALEGVGARPPIRRPYTAPERSGGESWDERADIYSFGAIAHELLTGRRPAGPGEQDGALSGGLTPEQRVSVRKVLARGLAERPSARFESAAALVDALETAMSTGQLTLPAVAAAPEPIAAPRVDVEPEHAAGVAALSEPEPEAIPEPEVPAVAPMVIAVEDASVLFNPEPDTSGAESRTWNAEPGTRVVEPPLFASSQPPPRERSEYPWAAIAAVLVAGIVLGGALGYRVGLRRGTPSSPAATTAAPAPGPGDTEVAIKPEPPPPPPVEPGPPPPAVPPGAVAERAIAPSGQLTIRSTPTGALVTVDGRFRGETPLVIRDLPMGVHTVQIARPGHVPWSDRVTLSASSSRRTVSVNLQPGLDAGSQTSGSLFVDSRPRGARVTIDGRLVGTTPFRMPGMAAGRHDIRLDLDGYRSVSMPVTVNAAREARIAATLEPGGVPPGKSGPVR
jgi:serine/threonine protein kinase